MKFSTKTKYGLSAMILLAEYYESKTLKSLVSLSEELGISKIYLEQVFSQLKGNELVVSIKGPKGGYRLSRDAKEISVLNILQATESSLFDAEESPSNNIEITSFEMVFHPFQNHIVEFFSKISLYDLMEKFDQINFNDSFMYYL
ncbi:RrF2 family transcriptional regulator [Breznakia pachnodae]|uniref:Rrf2 family protein n=1 Tax=Breznakia pachnodae TaxID=265178 RepID=A0ABU0E4F3_9FIRM|nr:Rrf2 family transcriptional regulator [Breznakia pachnodae]MDQ0361783.1 Rrf2 family protein [Breznakia pachnodae]